METKTEYKLSILDELKRQARERDALKKAREQRDEDARLVRNERNLQMLVDMLNRTAPYSEFFDRGVVTLGDAEHEAFNYDTQVVVRFVLPEHAEIQARFVWEKNDGDIPGRWEHKGFLTNKGYDYTYWVSDEQKMWQVMEWQGTERIDEGEDGWQWQPRFTPVYFADLGDALLHAEKVYRDPADIQREVDDHNRAALVATFPSVPEPAPTKADLLLNALKEFVGEQIAEDRRLTYWP